MQTTLEDRYAIAMQEALKCLRNPIDEGENESDIIDHLMTTTGLGRDDSAEVVRRAAEKISPVAVPVQQDVIKLDSPDSTVQTAQDEPVGDSVSLPDFLRIARWITGLGGYVVPVNRLSKSCTLPEWQNLATQDAQVLEEWARKDEHFNVGLVGKQDGLWGFDCDEPSLLAEYEDNYGEIPTLRVRTVSGGTHLYFKSSPASWQMGNRAVNKQGSREELWSARVSNKYVVGVGSIAHPHNDKSKPLQEYKIVQGFDYEPIQAPETFLNFLIAKSNEANAVKATEKATGSPTATGNGAEFGPGVIVEQGGRNSALASYGGYLRQVNQYEYPEMLEALLKKNCEDFRPPLSEQEVETVAKSVTRYAIKDNRVLVGGIYAGEREFYPNTDLHARDSEDAESTWQTRVNNWLAEGVGQAEIGERFLKEVGATVQKAMVAKQLADDAEETERLNAPWDDPTELQPALSAVQPFDESFLPVAIRGWVKDVSYRLGVPMDFPGICAICTLAGVIGRRAFVHPKEFDKEWRESIALSGAVVAHSGATKSPVWKHFTSVLSEIDLSRQEVYKQQASSFESSLANWEKQLADFQRDKKTPHAAFINGKPVEPEGAKRCLVNDATPEKLQDILSDNPEGVLYYRDELSGWVAEFQKEGREAQRGLFLAAMNGDDTFTLDRIERGSTTAKMCCSVFGSFQPHLLTDFLNQDGGVNIANGMIPRFSLLVYPDVQQGVVYTDYPADKLAKENFQRICKRLAELPEDSINLHFQKDAQEVYKRFWEETKRKSESDPDAGVRSHLSKYLGVLPKIAALFQIVDLVCQNGPVQGRQTIDLEHLEQAIQLMRYLEGHMHRLYGCIKTEVEQAELALSEHVRSGDLSDGFTLRDIKRKHWTGLGNSEWNDYALETLEELNWLRRFEKKPGKQGGRPSNYWLINPAILAGWQAARRAGKRT